MMHRCLFWLLLLWSLLAEVVVIVAAISPIVFSVAPVTGVKANAVVDTIVARWWMVVAIFVRVIEP